MGLALAIISSLSYVALDVLRKLLGQRLTTAQIVIGINLGAASVFLAVLALSGIGDWDFTFVAVASVETITYTIASILYVQAVTLSPLSLTIPYLGFTPVVSAGVACLVLGEVPRIQGFIGIGLVVMGTVALHLEEDNRFADLLTAPLRQPGSWRMLVVASIWGTTTSLDKIAIAHASEALLAFFLASGSALILVGARFAGLLDERNDARMKNRASLLLCISALVSGAAVLCQFLAYRELLVAYVETIKRAGGLASVIIGALVFHEGGLSRRLPAAAVIAMGIIMITLL
jgi:drug/metabolite transporter (DMT)-like permease